MNRLSSKVAIEAFKETGLAKLRGSVSSILEQRGEITRMLKEIPQVGKIHPSDANFILFEVKNAKQVYLKMADSGVVIRYRGHELHCANCLRASVGTADENVKLVAKIKEVAAACDI